MFCKIIKFPTSSDIYSYVWGISDLSQCAIIDLYRKKFSEFSQIVPPQMIDPLVSIINVNPYILSEIKTDLNLTKFDLTKLKVFFTNSIDKSYINIQNIFNNNNNKINLDWNLSKITYKDENLDNIIQIYLAKQNPADLFY
jgi:hypothetical protein